MTTARITIQELAAREFGSGYQSSGAEQQFWDALPSMPPSEVARLTRAVELRLRYGVVVAALSGADAERVEAFGAIFSAAELAAMVGRS